MRTFLTSLVVLAFAAVSNAFAPAVRPAGRWVTVKAGSGLDADVAAELKKMEADAQKKLEEKKKQMEAGLKK